jgi:Matrixin
MRFLRLVPVCFVALVTAQGAFAATTPPDSGFLVFVDGRTGPVTEVHDKYTGRVVWSSATHSEGGKAANPCTDSSHTNLGARWRTFEPFVVNAGSVPSYLASGRAVDDLVSAAKAWTSPFTTDCLKVLGKSSYKVIYGGTTTSHASLVDFANDGKNVVEFRSLAGTMCDVPNVLGCTIIDYDKGRIHEADMILETDLARTGFNGVWTTSDTTDLTHLAVSDAATHEFGHFAGLDHVNKSPSLTMYPIVGDGAQTLGLGDMKGLVALY